MSESLRRKATRKSVVVDYAKVVQKVMPVDCARVVPVDCARVVQRAMPVDYVKVMPVDYAKVVQKVMPVDCVKAEHQMCLPYWSRK